MYSSQNHSVDQIMDGTHVYDSAGEKLGSVVDLDSASGYLTVQKGWFFPKDVYVPLSAVVRVDEAGAFLSLTKEQLQDDQYAAVPTAQTAGSLDQTSASVRETQEGDVRVPVLEEELVVGTQRQEAGRVHLRKEVVEEQQTVSVPLQHEQVVVERVAVNGTAVDAATTDAFVERDIDIPLMGEEVVTDKRTRVVEEVRLRKEVVTEHEQVSETVRKERVVVDGDAGDNGRGR